MDFFQWLQLVCEASHFSISFLLMKSPSVRVSILLAVGFLLQALMVEGAALSSSSTSTTDVVIETVRRYLRGGNGGGGGGGEGGGGESIDLPIVGRVSLLLIIIVAGLVYYCRGRK